MEKTLFMIVFFYYIYIIGILYYLFARRKKAFFSGEVERSYFKDYKSGGTSELMVLQNHFNNQFQMPMMFFITCVVAKLFNAINEVTLVLAVIFVLSRFLHSYIHLTNNHIIQRGVSYFLGIVILISMWFHVLITS